jgi:adenylate cyclase
MALARGSDAITCVTVTTYKYLPVLFGAITINDDALCDTAEAVRIADQWGNDFTVGFARFTQGLVLINHAGTGSGLGFIVLEEVRESIKQGRLSMTTVPTIDMYLARAKARSGDLDGAIELSRSVVEDLYRSEAMYTGARPWRCWWNFFCAAARSTTCGRPVWRSTGWRRRQPTPVWC